MIPRPAITAAIRTGLSRAPAVVLLGARQVGKTTLARQLALETKGAVYLDLAESGSVRSSRQSGAALR